MRSQLCLDSWHNSSINFHSILWTLNQEIIAEANLSKCITTDFLGEPLVPEYTAEIEEQNDQGH